MGLTPGDVYAVPTPNPADTKWGGATAPLNNTSTPILFPAAGFNANTLPIIVPGPQVVATSVPGGNSSAGNLVTNGTVNTLSVTFDRPMQVSTFTPGQVDQIMGPAGSISGPQYYPSTNSTGQIIPAATASGPSTLSSTLTVPSYDGSFTIAHISVELNAAFAPDSELTATLIAPDGTQVPLFSGVGGNGANFVNTVFDDSAETAITAGKAPFTGSFQPTGMLATLDGHTVNMVNPAAPTLWVPGVWTLQITNASTTASGMLDNWSLNITPTVSVSPVATSESTVNGVLLASQFNIAFPLQLLSGTYTIQLGPNILDQFGDGLDTTQNAGLQVLRGQNPAGPTITVNYPAADLPKAIPAPAGTTAGR